MRQRLFALTGLVIGTLLLATAGPAAAGVPALALHGEDRRHDPVHWAVGVVLPILDSVLVGPLTMPHAMDDPASGEASAA